MCGVVVKMAIITPKPVARSSSAIFKVLLQDVQTTTTTSTMPEEWHRGVCSGKDLWPNVTTQCEGCMALVHLRTHNFTCDGYCKSLGLQCESAYKGINESCNPEPTSYIQCSTLIPNAVCECIKPCSLSGDDCSATKCCEGESVECYEGAPAGPATCKTYCRPSVNSTCKTPFAHPLSRV